MEFVGCMLPDNVRMNVPAAHLGVLLSPQMHKQKHNLLLWFAC